jgi:hypothetical protein
MNEVNYGIAVVIKLIGDEGYYLNVVKVAKCLINMSVENVSGQCAYRNYTFRH